MFKRYAKTLASIAIAWCSGSIYADQPVQLAGAGSGCSPCMNACDTACGNGGGFYGSAGVLFLKSCSNGNMAYSQLTSTVANAIIVNNTTNFVNFDNGIDVAPRFELGWANGNGLGARIRYFSYRSADSVDAIDNFNKDFSRIDPNAGGVVSRYSTATPLGVLFGSSGTVQDPSQLIFEDHIIIQTWDLEATLSEKCGCLNLTWSAGVRFLHIAQEYNAFEALITLPPTPDFPPASPLNQSLWSGHNLNGIGPIIGIEGSRPICENLRIYGLGRVGLIFCDGHQEASAVSNFNPDFQIPPNVQEAHVDRHRIVTTTEVEFGAEYALELSRSSEFYIRGGLVAQTYFGAGNSSRSTIGGVPTEPKNDNLSLFGLHLTLGLRY
jgi:hypothetical protein